MANEFEQAPGSATAQTHTRSGHFEPDTQQFPATKVLVKSMAAFADRGIDGKSWVLINEVNNMRTYLNSYDGEPQPRVSAQLHGMDAKTMRKLQREYKEVPINECPFATQANVALSATDDK